MEARLSICLGQQEGKALGNVRVTGLGDCGEYQARPAFFVSTRVIEVVGRIADAVGGQAVVVETAEAGSKFRGATLLEPAMLLLIQDIEMTCALRVIGRAEYTAAMVVVMEELEEVASDELETLRRAKRVARRAKEAFNSPVRGARVSETGEGTGFLEWAQMRSIEAMSSGMLSETPLMGGLGVPIKQFSASGFFGDATVGSISMAAYALQVQKVDNAEMTAMFAADMLAAQVAAIDAKCAKEARGKREVQLGDLAEGFDGMRLVSSRVNMSDPIQAYNGYEEYQPTPSAASLVLQVAAGAASPLPSEPGSKAASGRASAVPRGSVARSPPSPLSRSRSLSLSGSDSSHESDRSRRSRAKRELIRVGMPAGVAEMLARSETTLEQAKGMGTELVKEELARIGGPTLSAFDLVKLEHALSGAGANTPLSGQSPRQQRQLLPAQARTPAQAHPKKHYFFRCSRRGTDGKLCPCQASADGKAGSHCCATCAGGTRCSSNKHPTPDPRCVPEGRVAAKMPSTLSDLSSALLRLGRSTDGYTSVRELQEALAAAQEAEMQAVPKAAQPPAAPSAALPPRRLAAEDTFACQDADDSDDDRARADQVASDAALAREIEQLEADEREAHEQAQRVDHDQRAATKAYFDDLCARKELRQAATQQTQHLDEAFGAPVAAVPVAAVPAALAHGQVAAAGVAADAAVILAALQYCGGEFEASMTGVQPEDLRQVIQAAAAAHPDSRVSLASATAAAPDGVWAPWAVVPITGTVYNISFENMVQTASQVIGRARGAGGGDAKVAVMVALSQVATSGGHARAGARTGGNPGSAGTNEQVRAAAERLGASGRGSALAAINALDLLSNAAAHDETRQAELRAAVRELETSDQWGADVSMMLHQENLGNAPTGAGSVSAPAMRVWRIMSAVRPRLLQARTRYFGKVCPHGVDAGAVITAINTGKLTVALLAGLKPGAAKTATTESEIRNGVLRAWPVMVAIVRDILPRDASAEYNLLLMAKDASDAARAMADPMSSVTPVFEEMSERYTDYLTAGAAESQATWEKVKTDTTAMALQSAAMAAMHKTGGASAAAVAAAAAQAARTQAQLLQKQKETAAANVAAAKKASLALAQAGGDASSFAFGTQTPAERAAAAAAVRTAAAAAKKTGAAAAAAAEREVA